MKIRLLICIAVLGLTACSAQAALLTYSFTSGSTAAGGLAAHVSGGAFSAQGNSGAAENDTTTGLFDGPFGRNNIYRGRNNWNVNQGSTSGNYFQFTVTAATGYRLNLTSFSILVNSDYGPTGFDLRSSRDNYGSVIGSRSVNETAYASQTINFVGSQYQNLQTITFRIYGWGDNNGLNFQSDFNVDDVTINGSVVPEPTHIALGLFGLGAACFTAGRRFFRRGSR